MMYAYRDNGRWIFPVAMRSRFADVGGWHTLTDAERAVYDWYPFEPMNYFYDQQTQVRSGPFNVRLEGDVLKADYVVADRRLDELRQSKRIELKAARNAVIGESINNVQVGRLEDRENITGTIENWESLGLTATIRWVMYDNSIVPLSKQDLIDIKSAYMVRKMQNFAKYDTKIQQVVSAQDDATILSIRWEPDDGIE